jgi:small subunit ribosomal protein S2
MISLEQMLNCRIHLGHKVKKWNPKMSPYIFGVRNGIHIIDLVQTFISLKKVSNFLVGARRNGKICVFYW